MRNRFLLLCAALIGLACPAFAQMDNNFSAGGAVKIGTSTTTCNAAAEGAIRYNSTSKCMDLCDGSNWKPFSCGFCPTSGLVGHWKFNESGNVSTAADSSGQGNNGTLTNFPANPSANWVAGKIGNALNFDGTNDYVNIGNPGVLNFSTGGFTISVWLKGAITGGSTRGIVRKESLSGGDIRIVASQSTGDLRFFIDDGAGQGGIYSATNVLDNNWHHAALLVTTTNVYGYVDGIQVISDTHDNGLTTNSNNWTIGATNASSEYFSGFIDDVRFYNRALSTQEIGNLYNGGAGC
jgi:hypothetical protein